MSSLRQQPLAKYRQAVGLLGWLFLVFIAAAFGGLASATSGEFYLELIRPSWAPPGWLFGPVWTLLYSLMGISAWLVWRDRGLGDARWALGLFLGQLVANALWTWIFFVWKQGGWAFAEIILLWFLILGTMTLFWKGGNKVSTALLLPYLIWVTFAAALNFATWRLNPEILG